MARSILTATLIAGFVCFIASTAVQADTLKGNPAQGRLDVYTCHGCHGIPGYNAVYPEYHVPRIAGQNKQYLMDALGEYRSGARKYPTMNAQAKSLTEQQIHDITAYLSSLVPKKLHGNSIMSARVHGNAAAGEKKATVCEACHGKDGMGTGPNFPALAGQYEDYLAQALHEYKDGQRHNATMNAMAAPLSDEDISNLAAFFSSMPSKLSTLHGKIQGSDDEVFHNP